MQLMPHVSVAGRNGMLGRRAPKLFAHVKDVLNRAGLTSSFGADYSSVLRSNLLVNPDYCSSVPATTIQGKWCDTLKAHCKRFQSTEW